MPVKKQNINSDIAIILSMALLFLSGSFMQNLHAQLPLNRMAPEDRRLLNRDKYDSKYPNIIENTSMAKPADTGDSLNVRLIGRWANGPCQAVAVQGSIAYFGNGAYMEIVDFSDPGNPVALGKLLLPELPFGIAVSDGYVYVTNWRTGLRVIDVNNPANPHEVGFIATNGNANGVAVNDGYIYLADGGGGLRIIDVTNPTNPYEIGSLLGDSPRAVAVSGSYAYIADGYASLRIIDVSNPTTPIEVGVFNRGQYSEGVAISGNYAFVIASFDSMHVIDVSNPNNPIEVGFYDTGNYANAIAVNGNNAYVAKTSGLYVIDIGDPYNPVEVGSFNTLGYAEGLVVSGIYAFVADWHGGLRMIDVSTPTNPQEVGFFYTGDYAREVVVKSGYAYIAASHSGLRIIDVSTPTNPQEIGFFITGDYTTGLAMKGDHIYLLDWSGLWVIDVSNPNNPQEIGFSEQNGYCITVKGDYAYISYGDEFTSIDISNPSNPQEAGFVNTVGSSYDVAVDDNYAYVSVSNGLQVIDIRNPSNPQEVGYCETGGSTWEVAVEGSYVYVANGYDGARVINVSIPTNPIEVGFINTDDAFGITVRNNYVYVGADYAGLRIIDVSNPTDPLEIGYFDTAEIARGIDLDSTYIYVADGADGLYIFEYIGPISGKPGTPLLSQPADNIFTNNTTPELTWNVPADNDGDLLHFKVEIATDNDFINQLPGSPFESQNDTSGFFNPTPPVAESTGQCSFTSLNSLADGEYWWRVTAWDGQEYSNPSSSRKFTVDTTPPYISNHNPAPDVTNIPITTNIVIQVQDSTSGVNQSSIVMKINDEIVTPDITGTSSNYTLTYDPAIDFDYNQQITISIDAQDIAGNSMGTERYSFLTESIGMVSTPTVPTGLSSAKVGESIIFISGGSISDLGNDLEYRFDFGDGTISAWGDTVQSHIYITVGTYIVKAQARSQSDTTVVSNWSSGKSVILSGHLLEITMIGSGSVTREPDKSEFNHSEKVILTAVPSSGYQFDHWEGSLSGKSNPDSLTMASDMTVTANFTDVSETVTVLPNPFTPNDDGFNDYVAFKYPEMETRKPVVRIFNLRGRKVNELNHFSESEYRWYGKDEDGKTLEPGVYLYILEVDNKTISSGTITLVR